MNRLGSDRPMKQTNLLLLSFWLLSSLLGVIVVSAATFHLVKEFKSLPGSNLSPSDTVLKLIANLSGSYATLIAFLTLCLAGTTKHIKALWPKAVRFLLKSHLSFGWVVLGLSVLHGAFFIEHFFNPGNDRNYVLGTWTGIVTLLIAAAVTLGPYEYLKLPKKLKSRPWHRILGFALCFAIVLHVLTLRF